MKKQFVNPLALLACRENETFAEDMVREEIMGELKPLIIQRKFETFSNGEIGVELLESVRGYIVFVIQTFIPGNINNMLMELLLTADALRRAGAKEIHAVVRIYPYGRQERREKNKKNRHKRRPISARVIADMISLKFDGVIAFDLHSEAIEGFFEGVLVENIIPFKIFSDYLRTNGIVKTSYLEGEEPVLIAPDSGSSKKVSDYAENLGLQYAIVDKRRMNGSQVEIKNLIGDVKGRPCIIIDDITATGGTLIGAKNILKEKGATDVIAMVTHFEARTDSEVRKLADAGFSQIIITDSITLPEFVKNYSVFKVLPLAPMVSKVVINMYNLESLQSVVFAD
jgi:ribose-phosphate pyrophosphokinase